MRVFTGPGYFVAHPSERDLIIDYSRVPSAKPQRWPAILSLCAPEALHLPRTHDRLRRVSRHVCVGRAIRGDEPMDAWFVLVRQEPASRGDLAREPPSGAPGGAVTRP